MACALATTAPQRAEGLAATVTMLLPHPPPARPCRYTAGQALANHPEGKGPLGWASKMLKAAFGDKLATLKPQTGQDKEL